MNNVSCGQLMLVLITSWIVRDRLMCSLRGQALTSIFPQDSAFTKLLTLNAQRVFTLTQKCLPLLRAAAEQGGKDGDVYRDPARIINVSTV